MIDSFHADNDVHHLGIVVMNVFDQLGLCIGGSGNENRTGVVTSNSIPHASNEIDVGEILAGAISELATALS